MHDERDRCLALAGVFQAICLMDSVARNGMLDAQAAESSIRSLFRIDAATTDDVFEGVEGVAYGLRKLHDRLGSRMQPDLDLLRYVMQVLQLDRKLAKRPEMLDTLGKGIGVATARLEHFPPLHANILAQLADLYSNTISTLKPRIMVQGEPLHLANTENVNRVRALLLAAIRSARLFHQVGGSRFQLLIRGGRYRERAGELLEEIAD